MKLPRLRAKLARHTAKLNLQNSKLVLSIGAVLILVISILMVASYTKTGPSPTETKVNQEYLLSQVDNKAGAPRDGRDPAIQQQTSLDSAASNPTAIGQRNDKPATGVTGDHSHHNTSADVYGDPNQTGIGSNGCYLDYGVPGEQCVPVQAATDGTLTCDGIHKYFSSGVKVSGTDRFQLDTNHDGIACGTGD